jgi:molybdate transport repressor ModE-like protein
MIASMLALKSLAHQQRIRTATAMMNLIHWRLMVAVADEGNISKAAERCGITQSGASQAIAQMEDVLGVQLFTRERRQTSVTAIGAQVLERARAMLAELDAIRQIANHSKGMTSGSVTLASFPSVFASILPVHLQAFARLHPEVDVITLEGTDEEVQAWLAEGAVDVGVVLNPAPEQNALSLGRDAWVAAVPSRHPLARRHADTKLALKELAAQPFVLATGGCHLNGRSLAERAGLELADVRITVRDWASAYALIRQGLGVSIVPESTLPADLHGIRVFPLVEPLYREFALVCSRSGQTARPVQALLDLMRKTCRAASHDITAHATYPAANPATEARISSTDSAALKI